MPERFALGVIGWMLGLAWVAALPAQAQDLPPQFQEPVVEPLHPPFFDDFLSPNIDPARWTRALGVETGQAEPGLRLEAAGQPPPRVAELCTAPINLEQVGPVKVGVIATPISSKTAAPLAIEYLSSGGDWRELRRAHPGPALPPGGLYLDTLPVDGQHRLARVRFRVVPGADTAGWSLREVAIVPARYSLRVACRSEGGIGVTPPDLLGRTGGSSALMRFFEGPVTVTLFATARTSRQIFERWEIGGRAYPAGQNVVTHLVDCDLAVLAEYALLGDLNGDGVVDRYDLDAFVLATVNPKGYAERYPEIDRLRRGDMNGDGLIDELDIEPFVERLLSP